MNRRAFLQRFAQVSALLAAAPLSLAQKKKISPPIPPFAFHGKHIWKNPEWESAPYEIGFVVCGPHNRVVSDPWPWRFRNPESAQHFMQAMKKVYKSS